MTITGVIFQRIKWALPRPIKDAAEITFARDKYLQTTGWTRSRREGMTVDQHGEPLPWYTYPAISFLDPRIPSDASVFEFGMGNSTLWWSKRVRNITSCESDQGWFDRITRSLPENATGVIHAENSEGYVNAAREAGTPISILAIDGRRRVECCKRSLDFVADDGVVIWDNSERERYAGAYEFLQSRGFSRLDFWGLGPLNLRSWCTSVFYRPRNSLGI